MTNLGEGFAFARWVWVRRHGLAKIIRSGSSPGDFYTHARQEWSTGKRHGYTTAGVA